MHLPFFQAGTASRRPARFQDLQASAAAVALLIAATAASAAQRQDLSQLPPAPATLGAAAAVHERLGLAAQDLQAQRSKTYANGRTVTRYQQHYQGIPLWGEAIVSQQDAGLAAPSLHGQLVRQIEQDLPDVRPSLSQQAALALAKGRSGFAQHASQEEAQL